MNKFNCTSQYDDTLLYINDKTSTTNQLAQLRSTFTERTYNESERLIRDTQIENGNATNCRRRPYGICVSLDIAIDRCFGSSISVLLLDGKSTYGQIGKLNTW